MVSPSEGGLYGFGDGCGECGRHQCDGHPELNVEHPPWAESVGEQGAPGAVVTTEELIALARNHAPSATMRSSADLCVEDAIAAQARGDDAVARMWAERSLGYSVGVFKAREMARTT